MDGKDYREWLDTIEKVNKYLVEYGRLNKRLDETLMQKWEQEEVTKEYIRENEKLKKELADAQEVIKGYHDSVLKELDLDEKEELADLQFEKGVKTDAESV